MLLLSRLTHCAVQKRPSFGNQRLLHFEVMTSMAVRDIKAEKYTLISWFLTILGVLGKVLVQIIFGSVQKISQVDSQSMFQMFTMFTGRHILQDQGGPPTWRLHTKVYNFKPNISNSTLGQRIHLNLENCLPYVPSIISQFLDFIYCMGFDFILLLRDDTLTMALVRMWNFHFHRAPLTQRLE